MNMIGKKIVPNKTHKIRLTGKLGYVPAYGIIQRGYTSDNSVFDVKWYTADGVEVYDDIVTDSDFTLAKRKNGRTEADFYFAPDRRPPRGASWRTVRSAWQKGGRPSIKGAGYNEDMRSKYKKNPAIVWGKRYGGRVEGKSGDYTYLIVRDDGHWPVYVSSPKLWGTHELRRLYLDAEYDVATTEYEAKDICDDFNRGSESKKARMLGLSRSIRKSPLETADTRTLFNLYRKLGNRAFTESQTASDSDLYLTRFRIAKELEKRGWTGL